MTCSESGMMRLAISPAGGVCATQGAVPSTSKNMAPVSRTARKTSDKISMPPLPLWCLPDPAFRSRRRFRSAPFSGR